MSGERVIFLIVGLAAILAIGQAVQEGPLAPQPKARASNAPSKADNDDDRCTTYRHAGPGRKRVTFYAVGDTLTDRNAPGGHSWVPFADSGRAELVDEWAKAGVGTEYVSLKARVRGDAEVLVLLVGTNDLRFPFAYDNVERSIQRTVDRIDADEVLLSSVPPINRLAKKTADFNDFLARVAYRHDWSFVDAGSSVRGSNCKFLPGMSTDGVSLTEAGAERVGEAIQAALTKRGTAT